MTYETKVRGIGRNLGTMLSALWERYRDGRITLEEFLDLGAVLVATANGQARAVARLSLAAYVTRQTGRPLRLEDTGDDATEAELARISSGLETIATVPDTALERLERLAGAEPLAAGVAAYAIATRQTPGATGWERITDSDPCELCQWWAANSPKFRPNAKMPTHPNCACVPAPVFNAPTTVGGTA